MILCETINQLVDHLESVTKWMILNSVEKMFGTDSYLANATVPKNTYIEANIKVQAFI